MTATRRRSLLAVVLLVVAASLHGQAAPRNFLWKATNARGAVIFLAGSVHLLSPSYYPLDPAFTTAFSSADTLVEELDLGEMLAPESQMKLLNRGLLPPGQTLDRVVSPSTMVEVSRLLTELGLPVGPMKQFKPWMLAITLQSLAWQKAGFEAELGLDKHFYDMARAAGKRIQGLETMEFQISRFDEMPEKSQDQMLLETIEELDSTKKSFTEMADAWKSGDVDTLERLVLTDLKAQPELYQRLLVERNRTWLPKLEALFAAPRPSFVVVGAAHLIGTDGLLQMLKAKGYTVEQL